MYIHIYIYTYTHTSPGPWAVQAAGVTSVAITRACRESVSSIMPLDVSAYMCMQCNVCVGVCECNATQMITSWQDLLRHTRT